MLDIGYLTPKIWSKNLFGNQQTENFEFLSEDRFSDRENSVGKDSN